MKGRGVNTALVEDCKAKISKADDELKYIEQIVNSYMTTNEIRRNSLTKKIT